MSLYVLYGSETGTSMEVAERIGREARRRYLTAHVMEMDEFDLTTFDHLNNQSKTLFIFVCSTTGQGDEPENMKSFWRFLLRKSLPPDCLRFLKYTVFGLGDSSYQKYNFAAKKLNRRLLQLGASCFYEVGFGDDQHFLGADGTLDPWLVGLWKIVISIFPIPVGKSIIPDNILPPPKYLITLKEIEVQKEIKGIGNKPYNLANPFYSKLVENERMTAIDHFQDVRCISLDITGSGIQFEPGDVAAILPENIWSETEDLVKHLGFEGHLDKVIHIGLNPHVGSALPKGWPSTIDLKNFFLKYLDIFATPRRYFFELCSFFASNEMEKEKLVEFASSEGQESLYSYNQRMKRTCLEVLQDFPSIKIPIEYLCDVFSPIKPRYFSISSSQKMYPNQIRLTVAIVNYKTKMSKPRTGICTKWLSSLPKGSSVPVWVVKGTMQLPKSLQTPIVMIGPGTGCAPFISFIQDRVSQGSVQNIFFFGCRGKEKDFLHSRDLLQFQENGLLQFFVAFSRDQENKIYVQHKIRESSKLIWEAIQSNAIIYLSGNSKRMPIDVSEALRFVFESEGGMTPSESESFLASLEKTSRYQTETWS